MSLEKRSNWSTLLRRWFSGEITSTEEQELDRFAQDDPFLADALDGYRSKPAAEHGAKVDQLKARFTQKERRRLTPLWRIAASIAILIMAGFAIFQINDTPQADLAVIESAKSAEVPPIEQEAQIADDADSNLEMESIPAQPSVEKSVPSLAQRKKQAVQDVQESPSSPSKAKTKVPADSEPEATVLDLVENKKNASNPLPLEEVEEINAELPVIAAKEKEKAIRPARRQALIQTEEEGFALTDKAADQRSPSAPAPLKTPTIIGQINSEKGKPLAGAKINIPGVAVQVVADQSGSFLIPADSLSDKKQAMVVTYQDYLAQIYFYLPKTDSFSLVLPQSSKLSAQEARNRSFLKQESLAPGPKNGYAAYDKYVKKNLKYPKSAKKAGVKGTVILQFMIDDKGRPTNILISKSLGYGCDQEAIRLIRKGPDWIGTGDAIAVYSIDFDF